MPFSPYCTGFTAQRLPQPKNTTMSSDASEHMVDESIHPFRKLVMQQGFRPVEINSSILTVENILHIAGLDSLPYPIVHDFTMPACVPKGHDPGFQPREVDYALLSQASLQKLGNWFRAHGLRFHGTLEEAINFGPLPSIRFREIEWVNGYSLWILWALRRLSWRSGRSKKLL
jgi:hypothetical protein